MLSAVGRPVIIADHDFTCHLLTPNVALIIDIPASIEGLFCHGTMCCVKDTVFESSSPNRHPVHFQDQWQLETA